MLAQRLSRRRKDTKPEVNSTQSSEVPRSKKARRTPGPMAGRSKADRARCELAAGGGHWEQHGYLVGDNAPVVEILRRRTRCCKEGQVALVMRLPGVR